MSLLQSAEFPKLYQVVESFCGSKPTRIWPLDRESEGFSGATVLKVVVHDDLHNSEVQYCLRGWPPESLPRDRLLGLHRLLKHNHECGVTQVAVPLRNRFGTTLHAEEGQWWQLEPWMPGRADFQDDPSDTRLRNAMIALAQWHEAASRFEPLQSEAEWFRSESAAISPTITDRLQRIHRFTAQDVVNLRHLIDTQTDLPRWEVEFSELSNLARMLLDLFDHCADRVAGELASYCDRRWRLHPCLRDIWHDHVLFEGEQVTGLIDASAARTETPATDLARLLGSFVGDDDRRWELAVSAYRSVRPLSDLEVKLARAIDRSTVLLSGLTWLERLFVERLTYASPPRILARLREIVARLECLAHGPKNLGRQRGASLVTNRPSGGDDRPIRPTSP